MPASFMTLFPNVLDGLKIYQRCLETVTEACDLTKHSATSVFELFQNSRMLMVNTWAAVLPMTALPHTQYFGRLLETYRKEDELISRRLAITTSENFDRVAQERRGEISFLRLFTEAPPRQLWSFPIDSPRILRDLPGMRLIDISINNRHDIGNYTVVFAPRAGHHSNIAERVAIYLRDHGMTRMAIVEQKCAADIPGMIDGVCHRENFDSQIEQYRQVLEALVGLTGRPPHLIAVCQPGPLLMATLILYPHLGRTFGSAGSPMHTEAQRGFLTDFARIAGEKFIDKMIALSTMNIGLSKTGKGQSSYDGRHQVLGFYMLGMNQHIGNLKRLLTDLKAGNQSAADRQLAFYQWYNTAHHLPADYIRETYRRVFVRNELIRGSFSFEGRKIGVADFPASVPVWALGGTKDDIAPVGQAVGHMECIQTVPEENKLSLQCDSGHMGLFRSRRVLSKYYSQIAQFLLTHSDRR